MDELGMSQDLKAKPARKMDLSEKSWSDWKYSGSVGVTNGVPQAALPAINCDLQSVDLQLNKPKTRDFCDFQQWFVYSFW